MSIVFPSGGNSGKSYLTPGTTDFKPASAEKKLSVEKTRLRTLSTQLAQLNVIEKAGPKVFFSGQLWFLVPWLTPGKQLVKQAEIDRLQSQLITQQGIAKSNITKLLAEVAAKGRPSDDAGTPKTPKTKKDQYSKNVIYNVSAVKEAYFTAGQSLFNKADPAWSGKGATDKFDNELYSRNTPAKVTNALELWSLGQSGKGMIQTWKPPGKTPAQYLDQNGNFGVLSDAKTIQRYGFQFLYNPGNISMTYGGVPDVDPSMMSSGTEDFALTNPSVYQSSITFEILLNRMFDMKYLSKDGTLNSDESIDKLWPQNKPDAATLKQIRSKGTMYDVEFLLQTMFSYEPIRSQLRGKTSDVGYLGAFPVEMHLGNKLRYVAIIDSISVNHVIFTDDMVPMFSTVSISAKRIPDYKGVKTKNGA